MKSEHTIPGLKGRAFNGTYYPKIKCVRQEPRHRIRQLLRSFAPLEPQVKSTK